MGVTLDPILRLFFHQVRDRLELVKRHVASATSDQASHICKTPPIDWAAWRSSQFDLRAGWQCRPSLVYHGLKGFRILNSQVCKHFTVHLDTSGLERIHELTVGDAFQPSRGIDAHDPQPMEVALALATMAVGVRQGAH